MREQQDEHGLTNSQWNLMYRRLHEDDGALLRRCCVAIETAIVHDEGLDGLEGEAILRALGYWPRKGRA